MLYQQQTIHDQILTVWEYHAILEYCSDPILGQYPSYALQAYTRCQEQLQLVTVLHDVSTQAKQAEYLAKLFTKHQLSPIHLQDAVLDFIS